MKNVSLSPRQPVPRQIAIDGVCLISLLPRAAYETAYTPEGPILGYGYELQEGVHAFASSRRRPFIAKPNHLSFVPCGCDVYSRSETGGEYLHVFLEGNLTEQSRLTSRFSNAIDPVATKAAEHLRQLLISNADDYLSAEYSVTTLCERAIAVGSGRYREPVEGRWITPHRLRITLDRIEADLSKRLTIHQLAAQFGLSAGFFARSFKAAIGKAPHQYIMDRRIARARDLLASDPSNLAAIALATGFSSHAHMSVAFRQRLGLAPSTLKRSEVQGSR